MLLPARPPARPALPAALASAARKVGPAHSHTPVSRNYAVARPWSWPPRCLSLGGAASTYRRGHTHQ
jgi:hypothetical protein